MGGIRELLDGKIWNGIEVSGGNHGMGMEMKLLEWEGIGTKNLFLHTYSSDPSSSARLCRLPQGQRSGGEAHQQQGNVAIVRAIV